MKTNSFFDSIIQGGIIIVITSAFMFFKCNNPVSPPSIPEVITTSVVSVLYSMAQCGGVIESDGGSTITVRGVCWSTENEPTVSCNKTIDSSSTNNFTHEITGLTAGTTYYVRAYATNSAGTGYGNEISFTTLYSAGTVTDIDGNIYYTVIIGTQTWMAENLKVTHYQNGDTLSNYRYYNDNIKNAITYGLLYDWSTISDSRNIAPAGWHIPDVFEWSALIDYLGGDSLAGGKMKESGTAHWDPPNDGATNQSEFSALPGGCFCRSYFMGSFYSYYMALRGWAYWGSSEGFPFSCNYYSSHVTIEIFWGIEALSVRCVKD